MATKVKLLQAASITDMEAKMNSVLEELEEDGCETVFIGEVHHISHPAGLTLYCQIEYSEVELETEAEEEPEAPAEPDAGEEPLVPVSEVEEEQTT